MKRTMKTPLAAFVLIVGLAGSRAARAAPQHSAPSKKMADTSYGRFDGGVSLAAGLGASISASGPRVAADTRIRYIDTVGVFFTYEAGLGVPDRAAQSHILAAGIELRPLFLSRWALGLDYGSRYVDLFIDSLAVEMAPYWVIGNARNSLQPGFQTSIGFGLPLMGQASGLMIGFHGGLRWTPDDLTGGDRSPERQPFATLILGWQQPIAMGIAVR